MEMGLKDVADSRIGGSIIRGISGGEQRRVTIAIQLLKDPGKIYLIKKRNDSYIFYAYSNIALLLYHFNVVYSYKQNYLYKL